MKRTVRAHPLVPAFRNRRGERVKIPTVTSTFAKNEFGRVLETAIEQGAVAITRHETAKAVLVGMDEFRALVGSGEDDLHGLSKEFDALFEQMQGTGDALQEAFDATPAQLAREAVKAARKRG